MSGHQPVRSSRRRGGALLAVGVASSAFFLWLVFRDADLDAVWLALRSADLGLVLLAGVVIQGVYVAQVGEQRAAVGARDVAAQVQDGDAGERSHVSPA